MPRRARTIALLAIAVAGAALPALAPLHAAEAARRPAQRPQLKSEEQMLQTLRERLAAKLGAGKAAESRPASLVRVNARPEATAREVAVPRVTAPRPASARRVARSAAAPAAEGKGAAAAWGYAGEAGPQAWGGLQPEFARCGSGARQSPIDIREGIAVDLEPVQFDYRASPFRVIDNGHTVQVNVEPGNAIVARGERYELAQFHFHRPAEERIDGRGFDMGLHLVHKSADGRLAVVALLMNRGEAQPVVQAVWNNLPLEKHEEVRTRALLDLNHVLPSDRGYYTYMGSLTTPPCSEGVLWMVMRQPVPIAAEQIEIFARLYPMNARPIQSASGRMIKQSN
jgi:carbonic anhydrase